MATIISDVLEEATEFFVERANELRDEIGIHDLRLTIVYMGDGEEVTRASFDSR